MSSIPVRTNADDLELWSGSSVTSNELQDRDDDFEEDDNEQQVEEASQIAVVVPPAAISIVTGWTGVLRLSSWKSNASSAT